MLQISDSVKACAASVGGRGGNRDNKIFHVAGWCAHGNWTSICAKRLGASATATAGLFKVVANWWLSGTQPFHSPSSKSLKSLALPTEIEPVFSD